MGDKQFIGRWLKGPRVPPSLLCGHQLASLSVQAQMNASRETQKSLRQEHLAEKEKLAEKLEQEEKLKAKIQQLTEEKAVSSSEPGK